MAKKKPEFTPMNAMESRVDVTRIAEGLVRLDVYDERGQGSVILNHDEAKKIAIALTKGTA